MVENSNGISSSRGRSETRQHPYKYYPYVVIYPDRNEQNQVKGYLRNESKNGFSAEFEVEFPFVEDDVVDCKVGFQRAWARIVWIEKILSELYVVGFELHPEEFLRNFS